MSKSPLVSVLIPVYNSEAYVKEAVDSILNQTYQNLEVIIINDGSSDGSLEILENIQDLRVQLVSRENRGLVQTLNEGIDLATGEFLVRMDSDDISTEDRIEKQLKYMLKNQEVVVCGCFYEEFGARQVIIKNPTKYTTIERNLCWGPVVCHPSVMIKKSVFEDGLRFEDEFFTAEDYKLWVDVLEKGKIANIPEVLLKYRVHDGQITSDKNHKQKATHAKVSQLALKKIARIELSLETITTVLFGGDYSKALSEISSLPKDLFKYTRYLLFKNNFESISFLEKVETFRFYILKKININF